MTQHIRHWHWAVNNCWSLCKVSRFQKSGLVIAATLGTNVFGTWGHGVVAELEICFNGFFRGIILFWPANLNTVVVAWLVPDDFLGCPFGSEATKYWLAKTKLHASNLWTCMCKYLYFVCYSVSTVYTNITSVLSSYFLIDTVYVHCKTHTLCMRI